MTTIYVYDNSKTECNRTLPDSKPNIHVRSATQVLSPKP